MAAGPITKVSDIIVPEIFDPYVQQLTQEKSRLISSGAVVRSQQLDQDLAGGGLIFNAPSYKDLDNDVDNISTDDTDNVYSGGYTNSTPKKTGTSKESWVRLSRNQSWSSADIASALAGNDPMDSIANRVSDYWARRLQAAFIATIKGVFADNDADPDDSEHVKKDLTHDISGTAYSEATAFSTDAFLDATLTMGDSMGNLKMICVHSIVFRQMKGNNMIESIPDARGEANILNFQDHTVIVDDNMPNSGGVYESWFFGEGAILLGMGAPKVPTEIARKPDAGNGGGQEVLYNRTEWGIHPVGHRYAGTSAIGGPSNEATVNNLAHADSWKRVYPERKQIPIARLITREH